MVDEADVEKEKIYMLMKLVPYQTYRMTEKEVAQAFPSMHRVWIYYAFDTYRRTVEHILKLREEVLKDYPHMRDSDMEIRQLTNTDTNRFVNYTTLVVAIPMEDYLKLRKEGKLICL